MPEQQRAKRQALHHKQNSYDMEYKFFSLGKKTRGGENGGKYKVFHSSPLYEQRRATSLSRTSTTERQYIVYIGTCTSTLCTCELVNLYKLIVHICPQFLNIHTSTKIVVELIRIDLFGLKRYSRLIQLRIHFFSYIKKHTFQTILDLLICISKNL